MIVRCPVLFTEQLTGAAGVLLMKRSKALELGQPILGKCVAAAISGLAPRIMGIGPVLAIPKLMSKLNISLEDIDIVEINEVTHEHDTCLLRVF